MVGGALYAWPGTSLTTLMCNRTAVINASMSPYGGSTILALLLDTGADSTLRDAEGRQSIMRASVTSCSTGQ